MTRRGTGDRDRPRAPAGRARRAPARELGTFLFLVPMLLIFGVFSWLPIVRAVVMSVQDTNLVSEPAFVGLDNFVRVWTTRCSGPRSATPSGSRCSRS